MIERECMYCLAVYEGRDKAIEHIIEYHGVLLDELIDDTFVDKEEA